MGKRRTELLLARGLPLAEAESIVGKYGEELTPEVRTYVRASRKRANRAQMIAWGSAAVFLLLAIGAGAGAKLAFDQQTRADNAAKAALEQQRVAEAARDQAEQALTTATRMANTLALEIGGDPRLRDLPADLRSRLFDRAIEGFDEVIGINRDYWRGYVGRGAAYSAKGDFDRATADYDYAIALDPKSADAYVGRGNQYYNKGDLDRATADYNQAIAVDPYYADAYLGRGNVYHNKGALDRAIADYNDVIKLHPKYADAFLRRGIAYRQRGDIGHAITDFSQAIALDPKFASAYVDRAVTQLYAGSLPEALADLDRSSELDPRDPYGAIWLDIIDKRANLPSRLTQSVTQIDLSKWPAPVIRLYLGQSAPADVLAAADDADAKTKKDQVCEANFYIGELSLQQGKKEDATRLFRLAAAECPMSFLERWAAGAELKALGKDP